METIRYIPKNVKKAAAIVLITAATSATTYGLYHYSKEQTDSMCGGSDRKGCTTVPYYTCRPSGGGWGGSMCGNEIRLVPLTSTQVQTERKLYERNK